MLLGETIRMALSSLWSHKTRSLLTILGVVIGISSVLGIVTLGKSFEGSILGQFSDFDTRTVFVSLSANQTNQNGPPSGGQFSDAFSSRDIGELGKLAGVEGVTPSGSLQVSGLVVAGHQVPFRTVTATAPSHQNLRNSAKYLAGNVFHPGAAEIVLGEDLAKTLGNGTAPIPIGSTVEVRFQGKPSMNATLVGTLAHTDAQFGSSNNAAYVPVEPFYHSTVTSPVTGAQVQVYSGMQVLAKDAAQVDAVRDRVRAYFTGKGSDTANLIPSSVKVVANTQGDITAQISAAFDQITLFIGAIAVVSLVVGAIGIANIMLVSVTERTREIGVMKALGARNGEILKLFLVEAILIGLIGSAFGIALGLGLGSLIVSKLFAAQKIAVVIPLNWVGISLVVGICVGVLAGFLPARRATKIQPIKALAYE